MGPFITGDEVLGTVVGQDDPSLPINSHPCTDPYRICSLSASSPQFLVSSLKIARLRVLIRNCRVFKKEKKKSIGKPRSSASPFSRKRASGWVPEGAKRQTDSFCDFQSQMQKYRYEIILVCGFFLIWELRKTQYRCLRFKVKYYTHFFDIYFSFTPVKKPNSCLKNSTLWLPRVWKGTQHGGGLRGWYEQLAGVVVT